MLNIIARRVLVEHLLRASSRVEHARFILFKYEHHRALAKSSGVIEHSSTRPAPTCYLVRIVQTSNIYQNNLRT